MNDINLNIDPYTFTGSAYIIGIVLANELTTLEQDSVGNWLQLVGLTIQTYSSQQAVVEPSSNDSDLSSIKEAIKKIEKELDKIKKD